ncbi:olfactory receptor 4F3/4F16/4F29-like [Sarcophilus harrisii]|uniref:olfactory receptor 4F3/4F16/4F29-like n=1 Tax=Sarcophilus harrisii TaxID=9305 RepID=UPI001301EBD3|nr:olfactory receptor 4F3/4F16/4F29-like [Sarcophilus harrisii]
MDEVNRSIVAEFVFLGLSDSWEIQLLLFLFSSVVYVASILGNLLILLTVIFDPHLHSPMYFLLANLSLIDIGGCSIAAPKMICDLFRNHKVISFGGCVAQIFFTHALGGAEMVLLIAMAFDRYIAICKPLHYLTIMNPRMCTLLLIVAWITGVTHSGVQLAFIVDLPFCGPNVLDSFFCDLSQLIQLACTDTYKLQFMVNANSGFISLACFCLLLISYIFILVTVQKHSSGVSSKALSTLASHITVVLLFFCPPIFFYTWPHTISHLDKFLAIFDAVLTPFLNPVIYTFRNKEMKLGMRRMYGRLVLLKHLS